MTLEEEINRFEKLASNYEFNLEMHQHNVMKLSVNDIEMMKKYAQENRQLAEWLRELKAYKANREGYCNWCSNLKDRHLRIEYYWVDDEGYTASYVGKTNHVATGIARFCPCCGRFIEIEVNADDNIQS